MNQEHYPIIDGHPAPESVISVVAIQEADRRTVGGSIPSVELMRGAAQGVFEAWAGHRDSDGIEL